MKLYMILAYNKKGCPIGNFYVVSSSASKARVALKKQESGWIGRVEISATKNVIIAN